MFVVHCIQIIHITVEYSAAKNSSPMVLCSLSLLLSCFDSHLPQQCLSLEPASSENEDCLSSFSELLEKFSTAIDAEMKKLHVSCMIVFAPGMLMAPL